MHNSHQDLIDSIRILTDHLIKSGVQVIFKWIAGHANLAGNELADDNAKIAANRAKNSANFTVQNATTLRAE